MKALSYAQERVAELTYLNENGEERHGTLFRVPDGFVIQQVEIETSSDGPPLVMTLEVVDGLGRREVIWPPEAA